MFASPFFNTYTPEILIKDLGSLNPVFFHVFI